VKEGLWKTVSFVLSKFTIMRLNNSDHHIDNSLLAQASGAGVDFLARSPVK